MRFGGFFLGLTQEEAALLTKPATLWLWWLAQFAEFELPGGAISVEIQNPFTRGITILGAIPADFLASGKHHRVVVFFDLTLELAFRRPPEYQ